MGLPFMEIEGEYIPFPCVAEVKLDGEFQYVIKKHGKLYLANKPEHGRIRTDMPALGSIDIPDDSVLLGELVWGAGSNFYDFMRHKLEPDLNLAIFGCLRYDGEDIWQTHNYIDTRKLLEEQTFWNSNVAIAPRMVCRSQDELDRYFQKVVSQGFEGIVIKDPLAKYTNGVTGRWAKRKYTADSDLVIIGFQSGSKKAKTLSIWVGHMVDGKIEPLTHVGGGFGVNTVTKESMLKILEGMVTGKTGDDYHVEPRIVVTVKHYGAIRNADGSVSSLRHPQFKCIRLDKTAEQIDTIV